MTDPAGKIRTLDEAVSLVESGMAITAGGFAHSHQPMAFTRALIRRGVTDLTLMSVAECWVGEFLAAAGALSRAYYSNFMFEGFGRCRRFSEGVEGGTIRVEDHSHFGMVTRLQAAGLGLPFMPMRAMAGTDILDVAGFEPPARKSCRLESPFGNGTVTALSPLKPDVAVLHVARADRLGNVQLFGPSSVIEEQARAAETVIVTTEELVETDEMRRQPELTLLPGFMVDAVVHLPFGAHPTGVYGYYDHDPDHLRLYYEASRTAEGARSYLREWTELADHWAYLDRIGMSHLMTLRTDPALGYRREDSRHA